MLIEFQMFAPNVSVSPGMTTPVLNELGETSVFDQDLGSPPGPDITTLFGTPHALVSAATAADVAVDASPWRAFSIVLRNAVLEGRTPRADTAFAAEAPVARSCATSAPR
ncbi:hypothetical protein [Streptomyces sp. T028]|uniref:hypothetical protein n=1 Tax=Streptomyces sp. T028 TaxID=3394379 RepID=UPI003A8BA728